MDNLIIEKAYSTPQIKLDATSNKLFFGGESFPENAAKFYAPVFDWIREYIETIGTQKVTVDFEIKYFNSSTSKIFMTLFDLLDEKVAKGANISVNWHCDKEDETAIECGVEFKEDISILPFSIVLT